MKKTDLILISSIFLFVLINVSLAQAGYVWIKVEYLDSCPRSNADVWITEPKMLSFGTTNESGLTDRYDFLDPSTVFHVEAYYPWPTRFGPIVLLETDQYGNGYTTITDQSILDSDVNGVGDCHQPQWRNQGQNQTSFLKGDTNLLYAQAKSYKLDWAWLATNETGLWQNKTYMDMNDATEWTWSNFTWQNSSFTANSSWRIYYNDTSGFTNVTNDMTFEVLQPTCGLSTNDIDFDILQTGQISADNTITLTNTGNSPTTTLTTKGDDWIGTPSGSMTVGQTHWSLTGGQNYNSMTTLTTSDQSLGQQVSPGNPLPTYFKLSIPLGQLAASYTQTITFTGGC